MSVDSFFERLLAGRWIAGPLIEDAIRRARMLNRKGIGAILNYLGEDFADKDDVDLSVHKYLKLIDAIHGAKVRADVSVKPTQIGLAISYAYASANYSKILERARKYHTFVWLDMESHGYVDDTIRLYLEHLERGNRKDTGICVQSYLRRSGSDVKRIVKAGGIIRLVKGAYKESAAMAYANRAETTANYAKLMKYLFGNSGRFTIATHDTSLIDSARALNAARHKDVTYAMLNGIKDGYARELASGRENVYVYVPFGERWVDYSVRRLRELSNALLIVRSLFSR